MDIPFDRLGISDSLRAVIQPSAPLTGRLSAARVDVGASPEESVAALYVLATADEPQLRRAASTAIKAFPKIADTIHQRTHPKVLEWLAHERPEPEVDAMIVGVRNCNDRTVILIASRADALLCERICDDHERLLLTPEVLVALFNNPRCAETAIDRARGFLRMEQCLPDLPPSRGAPPPPPAAPIFDLDAEIEAALAGRSSPMLVQQQKLEMFNVDGPATGALAGFSFDFKDDDDFSMDMLMDGDGAMDGDAKLNLEKRVAAMSPGKKIKLAYLGNKEVRAILIRDRNKQVSSAVVKAGRLTDAEVLAFAANRNLYSDVMREIAANKEWVRKYPVKVALVNNPRTPISISMGFVSMLQKKDLEALSRNRNVASVLTTSAFKLTKAKTG